MIYWIIFILILGAIDVICFIVAYDNAEQPIPRKYIDLPFFGGIWMLLKYGYYKRS